MSRILRGELTEQQKHPDGGSTRDFLVPITLRNIRSLPRQDALEARRPPEQQGNLQDGVLPEQGENPIPIDGGWAIREDERISAATTAG